MVDLSSICRSTTLLSPPEDPTVVSYLSSTLWGSGSGSWWWNTHTESSTLSGVMLMCQVSKNFKMDARGNVEQYVSEMTHIPNVLRL